jgi:dihydrofolate reductase
MAKNRVIGRNNQLPWRLPEDLKRFKSITMGHPIVMGRKTFESIGRVLPGRENVIISRQIGYQVQGARVVSSLDEALIYCESLKADEAFIVGGAEIYRLAMPKIDRLHLTWIEEDVEGDSLFPEFDWEEFQEISRESYQIPRAFSFIILDRKSHR